MQTSRRPGLASRWTLAMLALGALAVLLPAGWAAQRPQAGGGAAKQKAPGDAPRKANPADNDARPARQAKSDSDDKNAPQAADLETDDGVMIATTYFPSSAGKSAPVVILLHGYGDRQKSLWDLAAALQKQNYAVLTLDFRGHGYSTALVRSPVRPDAKSKVPNKIDYHDLGHKVPYASLLRDVETAKRFLVRRNNAGELNISKLGVVGAEMGASIGILWSFQDWTYSAKAGFSGKQGQDVQALALISPSYNFKGINVTTQLAELDKNIPILVIAGEKDEKGFTEANKMADAAHRARPAGVDSEWKPVKTKLRGTQLLNPDHDLGVDQAIVKFFDKTLKTNKTTRWEMREVEDSDAAGGP